MSSVWSIHNRTDIVSCIVLSVPARLGKGQGAKEIGHNLARERLQFEHNPARERNKIWAQFCGRSMKTWAQICKHCTVHQLSENTKTEIILCKKNTVYIFFFFNLGRGLCKSGRAQDRAQHPQKYA